MLGLDNLKDEEWRKVKGFENYSISNYGRLKVKKPNGSEKICSQQKTDNGYYYFKLNGICKKQKMRIHRLVAIAFIDNINNYDQVNHKNGNKWDNRVENLEWCNNSMNIDHRVNVLGYKSGKKEVLKISLDGKLLEKYDSLEAAASANNVSKCNISSVCHGRMKTSAGYKWSYYKK